MPVFAKIGTAIKSNFTAIGAFFADSWSELKKVKWPSRQELISYTIVVIVTVTIVALYFMGLDFGFKALTDAILK